MKSKIKRMKKIAVVTYYVIAQELFRQMRLHSVRMDRYFDFMFMVMNPVREISESVITVNEDGSRTVNII